MSHQRAIQFARTPLFADLDEADLAELAALTTTWSAAPGEVLFRQGDPGDRLVVVTSGALEAAARLPAGGERSFGSILPGDIVGELALLARGRRTATVRATADSRGFSLARDAFDLLRLQLRPVARTVVMRIGEVALERLAARYQALAAELGSNGASPATDRVTEAEGIASGDLSANGVPDSYLAQILFFRRFTAVEISALRRGLRVLNAPRGARIDTHDKLWIVLRGAVQTAVVHGGARRRVRLAGPGRCVGQIDLLAGSNGDAPPLEATLRERAVLLEVPHARARALLAGDLPGAERFAEAFHEDVVRALLAAEEQLAPVVVPA